MLQSMTAYGHSRLLTDSGDFVWELRSVNHRYLDIGFRLPEHLRGLEAELRDQVKARVLRGKVDVSLKFNPVVNESSTLKVDEHLLKQVVSTADFVSSLMETDAVLDPLAIMQWPGVIEVQRFDDEAVSAYAIDSFEAALDDFLQTRIREGAQMGQVLEERTSFLLKTVGILREHRPSVLARQRDKLHARLAELSIEYDAQRLEQELVYAAQKLDISEELDRLDAHLAELSSILKRDGAVGRRMDFLMQELNREANTVASKSNDVDTTAACVDMKVCIEQLREQVQNIE